MKTEKIIIRKDDQEIDSELRSAKRTLAEMQQVLNHFNQLTYVEPVKKENVSTFLSDTRAWHEQEVKTYLLKKSGFPELPPNIEPLKTMHNIESFPNRDYSETPYFNQLQISDDGILSYPQTINEEIEARHTHHATPEQVAALKELERFYNNLELVCDLFGQKSPSTNYTLQKIEIALQLKKPYQMWGAGADNKTPWNLNALEKLVKAGFGQTKN
jgi:hypothetical protein